MRGFKCGDYTSCEYWLSNMFRLLLCSIWIFGDLSRGRDVKIGVHSNAYHDLVTGALQEVPTNNHFTVDVIPDTTGTNDYDRTRELLKTIRDRNYAAIMGAYVSNTAIASQKLGIPYFLTSLQGARGTGPNVFNMLPDSKDIVDCILKLIGRMEWKKVGIMCEDYVDPSLLSALLQTPLVDLRLWQLATSTGRVDVQELRKDLLQLRSLEIREILLLTKTSVSVKVLEVAARLGMVAEPYKWIILNLGSDDFTDGILVDIMTNVTVIRFVETPVDNEDLGNSQLEIATIIDSSSALDATLTKNPPGENVVEHVRNLSIHGKTGIVNFDPRGCRTNFSFGIHSYINNSFQRAGEWKKFTTSSKLQLSPYESPIEEDEKFALRGKKGVQVVTILESPWCTKKSDFDLREGNDRYQGFSVDIMEEISRELGFEYELYIVHDGKFGSKLPSGEWNGVVGEVMSRNATMSVAPLSINAEREEAMDFTKPFKTRGITVLIKTPESQSSYFEFMSPLSSKVWACVLGAMTVVSVVLYLVERRSKAWRKDLPRLNVAESWWFTFGAIAGGGTESSPITLPGRLLTSAWWFFSLILISTYTANLAAFLTVKKINPPISSVADLIGQSKIKYGTVTNSGVLSFFSNTNVKPYSVMYEQMQLVDGSLVNSTEEGKRKIMEGNYAFLWDNSVNKYLAATNCEYTEIGPAFDPKGFGIGLATGTTYREELSMLILRLADNGKISEMEEKWWRKNSECVDHSKPSVSADETSELELENVAGIFFVLGGGVILAFIACAIDHLAYGRKKLANKRLHKKQKSRAPPGGNGSVLSELYSKDPTRFEGSRV